MRILLLTDQYRSSDHSAIEAIFGHHLQRTAAVERVYFDRDIGRPKRTDDGRLILPHRCRRTGLLRTLGQVAEPANFDLVVVRNLFPVLRAMLAARARYGYRVAFWDSFPHAFRRRHEAERMGRARLRKALEYRWRHRAERRLLADCDAYLPITATHRELFFPELQVPTHPLPMGFDFTAFPQVVARPERRGPVRFLYAGTIDRLRRMDTVLEGFRHAAGEFELHLYTPTSEATRRSLGLQNDPRFRFHEPVPRAELMHRIAAADIGVSLIPPEKLYQGSSPTKTLEYYAAGRPALLSELADHRALFDEKSAFFVEFDVAGIAQAVTRAARRSRPQIDIMGLRGRERVREQRDYARLAAELLDFLAASARDVN